MKVLLIEDETELRNVLKANLTREGFAVDTASDGEQGSFFARTNDYNIIIMDNMLPGKLGIEICREIRAAGTTTPILMISVRSEVHHKVDSFDDGIDDYVTKPFSFSELSARIKALLRRPYILQNPVMVLEDVTIDIDRQKVTKDGKEIYLTRKEYSLLECLAKNNGYVLSRGRIMEQVWNMDSDPFSNTIEAHVLSLRKKLGHGRRKKIIKTVPGRGYKIDINPSSA